MPIRLAVLLLLLHPSLSFAHTYTLEPPVSPAGSPVRLRVDGDSGCFPANALFVSREANTINVKATLSDTVPCSPQWLTPRWAELGHFQAGTYEVVMTTCTNAPPPDQCRIDARLPLVVFEPQRFTVPTLTRGIEMILAVCLVIAGARLARSR